MTDEDKKNFDELYADPEYIRKMFGHTPEGLREAQRASVDELVEFLRRRLGHTVVKSVDPSFK